MIESPLFEKEATPETKEELAKLPTIPQDLLIGKIDLKAAQAAPPRPRTILAANRKAPPAPSSELRAPANNPEEEIIFYTAKGNEKLSFLARAFLGSPTKVSVLKKWNPALKKKPLFAGQKIRLKVSSLKPLPIYLSRDFITQYKAALRRSLVKDEPPKEYIVGKRDTLQKISLKLYSTTRRWTELYIINHESIKSPDALEKGLALRHY